MGSPCAARVDLTIFPLTMKRVTASTAILIGILLSLSGRSSLAQPEPLLRTGQIPGAAPVHAELVAECRAVRPGEPFWVGVRLAMADGWHVNWINPGDAGLAPEIEWTLPPGFSAGEIQWPYPRRHDISDLAIFGYENEIILACRVTPPAEFPVGHEITLAARVAWLACREACVPGEADLALSIPLAARSDAAEFDTRWKTAIDLSRNDVPLPLEGWRIEAKTAGDFLTIEAAPIDGEGPVLDGETAALDGAAFFPFRQGIIENSAPQKWTRDGAVYRLEVRRDRMGPDKPDRLAGVLVSQGGWGKDRRKAVAIDIPVD
jgi:DsbC/DsbD-like thiol-disulfide interchange protein